MTPKQVRAFVEASSVERIREVLDHLQKLRSREPLKDLPEAERAFVLDLRDHEGLFRKLADEKLQK